MNNILLARKRVCSAIAAALSLGLTLAGCSADELTGAGERLPEGKYPLTFTAVQAAPEETPQTRVSEDPDNPQKSQWTQGDQIKVKITRADGVEQETICTLNADGSIRTYAPQLYWQTTDKHTINAWYSNISGINTTPSTVSLANQSAGLAYVMKAEEITGADYKSEDLTLKFSHQLAKVEYKLKPGVGFTEDDLKRATVKVWGYTDMTLTAEGVSPFGSLGWITPFDDAVSLIPYTLEITVPFIQIETQEKETCTYTLQTGIMLQAGHRHVFTIQVDRAVYMNMAWEAADVKPGDYVYSDGTISDGGLRKILTNGGISREDIAPVEGKTCVGIVFHIRGASSPVDNCSYRQFTGKPTGYIVSLDQNNSKWCESAPNNNGNTPNDEINGYDYTATYASQHSGKGLIAIPWCTNHAAITSTDKAVYSTWYMPSQLEYAQMRGLVVKGCTPILTLLETNLAKAEGTAFANEFYFTCGLMGQFGQYLHMYNVKTGDGAPAWKNQYNMQYPYRAVCAFQINN